MPRHSTHSSGHLKKKTRTHELSIVLLGFLATLWAVQTSVYADSINSGVNVSVIVVHQSVGGGTTGGGTGGGGGERPEPQGLRWPSILEKIINNTFTDAHPPSRPPLPPYTTPVRPAAPPVAPVVPVSQSPQQTPDSSPVTQASGGTAQAAGTQTPTVDACRANPFAPGCDPARFCTLWSAHCIVFGIRSDVYTAAMTCMVPVQHAATWVGKHIGFKGPFTWLLILLWMIIGLRLTYAALKYNLHNSIGTGTRALAGGHKHEASKWYALNLGVLVVLSLLALFFLWESTRAASTSVGMTVVSTGIGMSCDSAVELGTITDTGDSGEYSASRATTCTVVTGNANGYALQWQVQTGSGGTNTGKLISQLNDVIDAYTPAVINTPETWSVDTSAAEWGGRLSSTSTTVSTGTWGTDGSSEKWLNVGTGAYTIANRTSSTSGGGDLQKIGFRAEVGSAVTQPEGSYSTHVLFTAITN
jgi:hypothetical protein